MVFLKLLIFPCPGVFRNGVTVIYKRLKFLCAGLCGCVSPIPPMPSRPVWGGNMALNKEGVITVRGLGGNCSR